MFFEKELIFMKRILEKTNINLFVVDYDAQIKNNIKNTFHGLLDYVDDNSRLCDYFPNLNDTSKLFLPSLDTPFSWAQQGQPH